MEMVIDNFIYFLQDVNLQNRNKGIKRQLLICTVNFIIRMSDREHSCPLTASQDVSHTDQT